MEKFTSFYEKMSNQQLDAIYIRKQLEDLDKSNEPSGSSGGRKQGGGPKDTPGKNVEKIESIFWRSPCMRPKRTQEMHLKDQNLSRENSKGVLRI